MKSFTNATSSKTHKLLLLSTLVATCATTAVEAKTLDDKSVEKPLGSDEVPAETAYDIFSKIETQQQEIERLNKQIAQLQQQNQKKVDDLIARLSNLEVQTNAKKQGNEDLNIATVNNLHKDNKLNTPSDKSSINTKQKVEVKKDSDKSKYNKKSKNKQPEHVSSIEELNLQTIDSNKQASQQSNKKASDNKTSDIVPVIKTVSEPKPVKALNKNAPKVVDADKQKKQVKTQTSNPPTSNLMPKNKKPRIKGLDKSNKKVTDVQIATTKAEDTKKQSVSSADTANKPNKNTANKTMAKKSNANNSEQAKKSEPSKQNKQSTKKKPTKPAKPTKKPVDTKVNKKSTKKSDSKVTSVADTKAKKPKKKVNKDSKTKLNNGRIAGGALGSHEVTIEQVDMSKFNLLTAPEPRSEDDYKDSPVKLGSGTKLGSVTKSSSTSDKTSQASPSKALLTQATSKNSANVKAASGASELYLNALKAFSEQKTDTAIIELKKYIKRYPNGKLIAKANYWLGESYLQKDPANYASARFYFLEVINKYKYHANNDKHSKALYRLCQLSKINNYDDDLIKYSNQLKTDYPNTVEARLVVELLKK